ncbi:DEAD/DEAH box helicase family protein [Aquimarina sp. TRL1]|uniref:strawberry notch C-terminal domain-containing protein n=1 Tax=Aquimarina sp. (strain TRL1) TaxID=2736252 RepID=UPI0015892CED|nr:strawberry notch C-terminal domain-containing protein [Aquimarina sp. TRL1]QKX05345.1 DEAD/DEAH box helicase family protein [Aquimarina sp. TRL1]
MEHQHQDHLIEDTQEEFTQDAAELAKLAASQTALVPYVTKSNAPMVMNTLIPKNMAFEVQKSLNRIVREKGNIDTYLRNELRYVSTSALWNALAAEQVDSVALYLKQFENNQGVIIADQTGIGKGRQAAAVIRHAIVNGYLPVFFTRTTSLFSEMYKDLKNIDFGDIRPFILNTDRASIKDEQGHVMFSPLSSKEQLELLTYQKTYPTESSESIAWHKASGIPFPDPETVPEVTLTFGIDHLPNQYNVIFTTYSQIQSAHPYKRNWLQRLCENSVKGSKKYKEVVLILDESHMAGGFRTKIGEWMREILPMVKSCCFLSATFAKYPEVMPFYGKKTAILETGLSDEGLVEAMNKGGLALQEIVASNLAESGQLIRRQRSNEGIEVTYKILDEEPARSLNRERVNRIITLMNAVVDFEREYINPVLGDIHKQAKQVDESVTVKPKGLGVKQAPYFSRVFNIVDQMLFALKVEEVARHTIQLLKEDKKVVIAFKSTMGSFLKEMKLATGDIVSMEELDFSKTLIKGLESVFFYNYTDITGKKTKERIPLESIPSQGINEYHRIRKEMLLESSGLTISPIDQLIHLIESEQKPAFLGGHNGKHFKVTEVTGRNQRLFFEDDHAVVSSFRSDTGKSYRLFNSGEYDVLLINQSGSTGESAHSSKEFKDRRQRTMISHQFELDINTEVQKIGRINRTGQVNKPAYVYIASDIPMELRLMTMLKGKLKSLDANTTGSQKTSDTTFQSPDLFNKYGDQVAWDWVSENPDLAEQLGNPTFVKKWNGELKRNENKEGAIRQVTGRAGLLYVEQQEELFNNLIARYHHQITIEKQQGTYDLETEFLPLDAELQKRFLQYQGKGGTTPFGMDTVREQTIINNLQRPFTKKQVDQRIAKQLQGGTPERLQTVFLLEMEQRYPQIMDARKAKRMEVITVMEKELSQMPEEGSGKDEAVNEKIQIKRERQQNRIDEKKRALASYEMEMEYIQKKIGRYAKYWKIGEVVKVPFIGAIREASWGIFTGIKMRKGNANPYTLSNISFHFAVVDQRKSITYDLKNSSDYLAGIYADSKEITEEERHQIPKQWNELIKKASSKREKRFILTENILAVSDHIGTVNKLIKYNTKTGTIKNGILMSRNYGKEDEPYALLPISEASETIGLLDIDASMEDHTCGIKFKRISASYLEVYISKKEYYKLALDPSLRRLIMHQQGQQSDELPEFVQNAGHMVGVLSDDNVQSFLQHLDNYGIKIEGEAKELEDWEIENIKDWNEQTQQGKQRFRYELGKSYGRGSNPSLGFVEYYEPDSNYPFGVVEYDRLLEDKEKYNYTLIPIYQNSEVPFLQWKDFIKDSPVAKDFKQTVKQAQSLPIYKAVALLGYFITNHPHQDGNTEFVFGRFSARDLGRAAYEDTISTIEALDIVLDKLQLAYSPLT